MRQCFDFLEIPNSTAVEGRFVNKTEACVMRPTNNMTKLAAFLPNRLRRSTVFKSVRHQALKYLTPSLPEEINADERNFLEEQLAEDIEWFHERFKIGSFANCGEAE